MSEKRIKVDYLARVEGEGALDVQVSGGRVTDLKLKIFEPPRFFEAFLVGRSYLEVGDITSRICGICPVAYQTSAANAVEDAFQLKVEGSLRQLRRLIYLSEYLESHVLHIYFLAAPDFLGYESAISMAQDYPGVVQRALRMKRLGNDLMAAVGGREVHPVALRPGGFYKVPRREDLLPFVPRLLEGKQDALDTLEVVAGLDLPDLTRDIEFVALSHPTEYAMLDGRVVSSKGLDLSVQEYEEYFEEEHVPYSNALHSRIKGRGAYFVGPLARVNLNFDRLSPD
ncbi:MAG: nickel-dependent hydrogenase large subunit, partial [Firmicutes bacterium]|nr:nickel-dependent hydrogenase large subunit [Bacillota bacterium]